MMLNLFVYNIGGITQGMFIYKSNITYYEKKTYKVVVLFCFTCSVKQSFSSYSVLL